LKVAIVRCQQLDTSNLFRLYSGREGHEVEKPAAGIRVTGDEATLSRIAPGDSLGGSESARPTASAALGAEPFAGARYRSWRSKSRAWRVVATERASPCGHVDPERNDPRCEEGAGPRLLELRRGIRGRTDDSSSAGRCRAGCEVRGTQDSNSRRRSESRVP